MLQDQKILITGMTGQIAFPMAAYLAEHNEVWGIARFSAEGSREMVEAAGVQLSRGRARQSRRLGNAVGRAVGKDAGDHLRRLRSSRHRLTPS